MVVEIHGFCKPQYEELKNAFLQDFEEGLEVGASCAVIIDGRYVVDIWAGHKDIAKTIFWEKDTLVNVYSITKIMTALCVHILVDKRLIDVEQPVAKYWPEFAQNGKEKLPVKYLMSHSAGLLGWDIPLTQEDLYNWDKVTNLLATYKPWWESGTQSGYHGVTFGYLLGELVRRITGKSLGTFFKEEVAKPLGADFHIGLPEEHDNRVAELFPPELPEGFADTFPTSIGERSFFNPIISPAPSSIKSRGYLAAEIPAVNGQGNARSMARIGSVVACNGRLDGRRYLSRRTIRKAIKQQIYGTDLIVGPTRWGLGWALPTKEDTPYWETWRACSGGGMGGSRLVMDIENKLCFAYAMNKMILEIPETGDPRTYKLIKILYECIREDK
ncbi:hypothetical protein LCGC14_0957940 [marine sediment metagenome]|uniref:Beta-lactamase-related domain-containing protein n=1 Tax=marine sediment metagenome TaxID=412755 RepID=A0A0F9RLS0_9ZZZZ|nr:class A beta-lactamase-related serine hydrolase [archaeon]